jgi:hypothetical protein
VDHQAIMFCRHDFFTGIPDSACNQLLIVGGRSSPARAFLFSLRLTGQPGEDPAFAQGLPLSLSLNRDFLYGHRLLFVESPANPNNGGVWVAGGFDSDLADQTLTSFLFVRPVSLERIWEVRPGPRLNAPHFFPILRQFAPGEICQSVVGVFGSMGTGLPGFPPPESHPAPSQLTEFFVFGVPDTLPALTSLATLSATIPPFCAEFGPLEGGSGTFDANGDFLYVTGKWFYFRPFSIFFFFFIL